MAAKLPTRAAGTYVSLDIEATGMDPARHEVIEIALVVFDRERRLDRFETLVRPRGRLPLDIEALTGIRAEDLRAAPTLGEVASEVRRRVAGRPIVGQSVWMDVAMLDAGGLVLPNPVYDTYQLATLLLPDLPAYNQATIAGRLGIAATDDHRALADAEVGSRVFLALLDVLDQHDATTLDQLAVYARTAGWPTADLFAAAAARQLAGPLFEVEGRRGPHELAFLTPRERPEPLRPTGSRRPIDRGRLRAALAADGALARVVPGYEYRPQQEAMAAAVADSLDHDAHLLVEAGTGTGKSLAYLLPAALHAAERGERVVISTNTLALQDQLYRKDVPDLRRALDAGSASEPFEATVLKGRANYLCLRRWFAHHRQPTQDPVEAQLRAKVLAWLGTTETGDRAELRLDADEEAAWRNLSAEEGACAPARCAFHQRNQCFLFRARRQAEHAHLVIVNHALLLSDTVAGSRVLPDYDRLVIDEAHHLEEQATSQFGFTVAERAIVDHLDAVVRQDGALMAGNLPTAKAYLTRVAADDGAKRRADAAGERIRIAAERGAGAREAAGRLFGRLREIAGGGQGGYDRTLRVTDAVRRSGGWIEVEDAWSALERALRAVEEQIRWFLDALEGADGDDEPSEQQREDVGAELELALRTGADLAERLRSAIAVPDPEMVYWLERSLAGDHVSLAAAPLHVRDLLQERLFAPLRSAVLTSATVTTDGTFDYVAGRIGLEDADRLAVASPFDYERSTLLYLADDIPEPNQPGYQRRLEAALIGACEATRGRALVLFTSHAALQATYKAIKGPLEDLGILVLAQRTDGSPRQLIERLKHTPNVVVLGTATFWEGVDVVGPALSLVVITKLPFAVPSDPVFAARSELFDQPFLEYAVPQAVLKFKQGFGRLIRSGQDRGVCAILDRRVLSKRYGASFVQSLPECSIVVGGADDLAVAAADWLADEE